MINKRLNKIKLLNSNPDKILQSEVINYFKDKKFKRVLDYGAGNSPYKKYLNYDEYKSLDVIQNKNKDIDLLTRPNKKIPIKSNYFDIVLLIDVISHIYDFNSTLKECYRVLKKNGKVFVYTPFIYRENETPNDFWRFTSFGIRKIINQNKFKDIKIKKIGNAYYTVFSILNEKNILNKEKIKTNFINRVIKKLINLIILPFLNIFVFSKLPIKNSGTFHHIMTIAKK